MDSEGIRAHLERVLASEAFSRAPRQASFLRYVVERTIDGCTDELKEYAIALQVFERPPSYDPRIDSTVRVEAAKLRQRLERYYVDEGSADPLRISIPKGSYVAHFSQTVREPERNIESEPASSSSGVPASPASTSRHPRVAASALLASAVAIIVLLVSAGAKQWANTQEPAPQPSIVVFPFADLSSPAESRLSAGLAEEIVSALSQLQGVHLVSLQSSARFASPRADLSAIREQLKVHAVLDGSARIQGNRLRVTAHLAETADGFQLWNKTYDKDLGDLLRSQREIARDIAESFRSELAATRRALVRPNLVRPEAHRQYLRAMRYAILDDPASMDQAVRHFKLANAADPESAMSWAGLARTFMGMGEQELMDSTTVCNLARDAAYRADELGPRLVETRLALGWYKTFCEWDWSGAEHEFRRALEKDPGYLVSTYDYSRLNLEIRGRFDEAVAELERATQVDPNWIFLWNAIASSHIKAGRHAEAAVALDRSIAILRLPGAITMRGISASAQGHYEEAITQFREALQSAPDSTWINGNYAHALAKLGRRAERDHILEKLRSRTKRQVPEFEIACVYAGSDERDQAFEWLGRAYERRSPTIMYAAVDPRLRDLRSDPRFLDLLRRLGLSRPKPN